MSNTTGTNELKFLDLFAGAGGLSEGFLRAGFLPMAHVEMDSAACYTLKTRTVRHWLNENSGYSHYLKYLEGNKNRNDLYSLVPKKILDKILNAEITNNTLSEIFTRLNSLIGTNKIDLIIGGPPCQAYSLVGRSRDKNKMLGDKRNYLYVFYAEFLRHFKPKYFIFENVTGLLSAKDNNGNLYFDIMRTLFLEAGYNLEYKVLSSEKYGVLQKRQRIFLVGKLGKKTDFFPEPDQWNPNVNVSEIFIDLPELQAGEGACFSGEFKEYFGNWLYKSGIKKDTVPLTFHQARNHTVQDKEIYKIAVNMWNKEKKRLNYNSLPSYLQTHKQKNAFLDRFKVVAADMPYSQTIVAHIARDGHYYIHPDEEQNRSITPREAARLQTFPDDYFFESVSGKPSKTSAFKQIGNAVPVLLAEKIAKQLIKDW